MEARSTGSDLIGGRLADALLMPLAIAAGYITLATVTTFFVVEDRVELIWLPDTVLITVLFLRNLRGIWVIAALCFAAKILKNLVLIGTSPVEALAYAGSSMVLVIGTVKGSYLLCGGVPRWNELRQLARFGLAGGIVAPFFAATLAVTLLSVAKGLTFDRHLWLDWFAIVGLGSVIGTPIMAILIEAFRQTSDYRHVPTERWLAILGLVLVTTSAVFAQSSYPLLFVVAPAVLIAAFQLGAPGAAAATLVVAAVSVIATIAGRGPIELTNGGEHEQVMVLQAFLLTIFMSALPVTAALDGRARLQRQLGESRDFVQATLDGVRDVIFRTDAAGRWTLLNPAWEEVTGIPVSEALGRTVIASFPEGGSAENFETFRALTAGDIDEARFDQPFMRADGEMREAEIRVKALRDRRGEMTGTIGNIRDVTDVRAGLRAVIESERHLQALTNLSPAGILRTSVEGELTFANLAWEKLAGLSFERAKGTGWAQALHSDDAGQVIRDWAAAVAARSSYSGEFRFVRPDRSVAWVTASAAPEFDDDGEVLGYVAITLDITERKAMERDIDVALRKAEEAALAKSQFLANMSHEIRTPMNGVIGFTEMLLSDALTPEQRSRAEAVAASGKAMMRLLNDILDHSKIEAGQMTVAAEPFPLGHVLGATVALFEPAASAKGLSVSLEVADELPTHIVGDALRVRQIVANLVGNAVKFTDRGSVSVVATTGGEAAAPRLEIAVKDTGMGIAPERQEAIFGEFVQVDESGAGGQGGTGLGLAISRKLAALMDGTLTLESVVGLGSIFRLSLPLNAVEGEIAPAVAPVVTLPSAEPGSLHVLVAEDHDINQQLVTALLDQHGARMTVVENGLLAVEAVEAARAAGSLPNIVLMDVRMPVCDGREATRRIRAAGIDAQTLPIVALTANAYAEDIAACLAAGMQAHLAKPVQRGPLIEVVEQWRRRNKEGAGEATAPRRPLDPALEPLRGKFEALCTECAALSMALIDALPEPDESAYEAVYERTHKLAGTAALFGEPGIGDAARAVEDAVEALRSGATGPGAIENAARTLHATVHAAGIASLSPES